VVCAMPKHSPYHSSSFLKMIYVVSGFRFVDIIIVTIIIHNCNRVLDDVIVPLFRDPFVLRHQGNINTRTGTYSEPVKSACAITVSSIGQPFWAHRDWLLNLKIPCSYIMPRILSTSEVVSTISWHKIRDFYCCTVHFGNIKILFTNECTLY
jgi:hypothetical protein